MRPPTIASVPLQRAYTLLCTHDYAEALRTAEHALARAPEDSLLLTYAGLAALAMRRIDRAQGFLTHAREALDAPPEAAFHLARILAQLDRNLGARHTYIMAIADANRAACPAWLITHALDELAALPIPSPRSTSDTATIADAVRFIADGRMAHAHLALLRLRAHPETSQLHRRAADAIIEHIKRAP